MRWIVICLFALGACAPAVKDAPRNDGTPARGSENAMVTPAAETPLRLPFAVYDLPDETEPQLEALGGGTIMLVDDCLYFGDHPVALPKQFVSWNAETSVLTYAGRRFELGSKISVNGGYSARASWTAEGEAGLPATCKGEEVFAAGTQLTERQSAMDGFVIVRSIV